MLVEMLRDVQPVLAELVIATGFDGEFVEDAEQRADSSWVLPTHPENSDQTHWLVPGHPRHV